jgi:hypothetical protein
MSIAEVANNLALYNFMLDSRCRWETPPSAWLQNLMWNIPMLQATRVEIFSRLSPRSLILL